MNPNRRFAVFSALVTIATAATILALAFSGHVYAPGARSLQQKLASTDGWSTFLNSMWFGDTVWFTVRKGYGAICFAILGFLAAPVFARTRRVAYTAAVFFALRLAMEIAEAIRHGGDSRLESAFDIVTGACAAALGAFAWNAVSRRREVAD